MTAETNMDYKLDPIEILLEDDHFRKLLYYSLKNEKLANKIMGSTDEEIDIEDIAAELQRGKEFGQRFFERKYFSGSYDKEPSRNFTYQSIALMYAKLSRAIYISGSLDQTYFMAQYPDIFIKESNIADAIKEENIDLHETVSELCFALTGEKWKPVKTINKEINNEQTQEQANT